jgi:hypothetical protein
MVLPPLVRRSFAAHTLCVTALLVAACTAVAGEERPNIVLLIGDDHGWDETGYNGHPHLKTPVLDEMARTALRAGPVPCRIARLLADARERAHRLSGTDY